MGPVINNTLVPWTFPFFEMFKAIWLGIIPAFCADFAAFISPTLVLSAPSSVSLGANDG